MLSRYGKSKELFARAAKLMPGGVSSPVRAFNSVNRDALFISRAEGPWVWDADGNQYVDYVGSYGPALLGHSHPEVADAVQKALRDGFCYGASSEGEIKLAEVIQRAFASMEMIRFVNSGTEAAMSVIRLARGFTGRNKIVKFRGCYHGHADALLTQAGSGLLTHGLPGSAGVTQHSVDDTLVGQYNDTQSVEKLFAEHPDDIAAIMLEPVAGNIGVVVPDTEFIRALRNLTKANGTLLIFDEVMSGFRNGFGGAQHFFDTVPDLTILGKVIGGGMPIGAYGGRRDIMQMVSPLGPVYQAGTLSGNPISMTAGWATLEYLEANQENIYASILRHTAQLKIAMMNTLGRKTPLTVNTWGGMITPFFAEGSVASYDTAVGSSAAQFSAAFGGWLDAGLFAPPSQYEAWFISAMHDDDCLQVATDALSAAAELL